MTSTALAELARLFTGYDKPAQGKRFDLFAARFCATPPEVLAEAVARCHDRIKTLPSPGVLADIVREIQGDTSSEPEEMTQSQVRALCVDRLKRVNSCPGSQYIPVTDENILRHWLQFGCEQKWPPPDGDEYAEHEQVVKLTDAQLQLVAQTMRDAREKLTR